MRRDVGGVVGERCSLDEAGLVVFKERTDELNDAALLLLVKLLWKRPTAEIHGYLKSSLSSSPAQRLHDSNGD